MRIDSRMPRSCRLNESTHSVALSILAIAFGCGCGDGVGRPIQQGETSFSDLTTGGASVTAGASGRTSRSASSFAGSSWSSSEAGWSGSIAGTASVCASVSDWDPDWAAAEDDLLLAINVVRAAAFDCITGDPLAVAPPQLNLSPSLRCAARRRSSSKHTLGSAESRLAATDVPTTQLGTVVATTDQTNSDPAFVLVGWLLGDTVGDCTNLTDPRFTSVGIGYAYLEEVGYWTVELAGP